MPHQRNDHATAVVEGPERILTEPSQKVAASVDYSLERASLWDIALRFRIWHRPTMALRLHFPRWSRSAGFGVPATSADPDV
jgi:hypothetical protein